jgi:cephalosporin hydroxylase
MKLPEKFNDILGMHSPEDMAWMLELCEQHAPVDGWVVNLGVFHGKSTMVLCEACGESRVVGIDHWLGGKRHGGSSLEAARSMCELWGYNPKLVTQDSREPPPKWIKEVGVLFIDTYHQKDHVRAEIEAWKPLLRSDVLVMFHDYYKKIEDAPVRGLWDYSRAIDDLFKDWINLGVRNLTVGFVYIE